MDKNLPITRLNFVTFYLKSRNAEIPLKTKVH